MHAGFWAFGLRLFMRVLNLAKIVVLARVLAPEDFGLMGIALLGISLLETFTQTGFREALIQRTGNIRPYLDAAWTMGILRSLLIAGILVLAAPFLASFLGDPRAALLLRVLALTFVFTGLTNIGIVFFEKELEFHRRFLFIASQTLAEVGVAITLAVTLRSVWALVFGAIAGAIVHLIASYLLHPYRPRTRLEWSKFVELFRFGKWILGNRILGYLVRHVDDILVARLIGAAGLGLYRMAYNMSELATTELTHVAGQVLFPAYSKMQERKKDLRRTYLKALHFLVFLSFPMTGGFFMLAPAFTQLILGEKWMPMVPALQLLIIWGLLHSLGAASGALFTGIGRPDIGTKIRLTKLAFLAVIIYPMTAGWGIAGAAGAVIISTVPSAALNLYLANRMVESSMVNLWKAIVYPLCCTLLMLLVLHQAGQVVTAEAGIIQFIGLIALGALTYGIGILTCRLVFGYTIDGLLTGRLKALLGF